MSWDWIDADGTTHAMATDAARVLKGATGKGMPPVTFVEDEVPFQPGTRLRTVKTGARQLVLPMAFLADDASSLQAALRAWLLRLHADRGDGQLRYTGPDGTPRVLNCRYADGMQFTEDASNRGPRWQKVAVAFHAFDPYWYDAADTDVTVTPSVDATTFFPFFPLVLTHAPVFASETISNTGDVDCWPVWEITGPASSIRLANGTTGKTLTLDKTLGTGDVVEVDTRPGKKSVTLVATGENLYGNLASGSSLWPLARGDNDVTIEADSTDADSGVTLSYRLGYLGA